MGSGRYNVERFFGRLENFKKIATRYEGKVNVFLALVYFACILILWGVLR